MHQTKVVGRLARISLYICLILVAGLFLALTGKDGIQINADSFAGITLARSLESIGDIKSAKFARIPSIVPDLLLIGFIPKDVQSLDVYVWFAAGMATLLLASGAEFIFITSSKRISRIDSLGLTTLITLLFVRYSPFYRQALGILLSPIYHGGNIILTILCGLIYLRLTEEKRCSPRRVLSACLVALITTGIISNRLFIFTCLIPLGLVSLLDQINNSGFKRLKESRIYRRRLQLIGFSIAFSAFITYLAFSYLDIQCAPRVTWSPMWTITSSIHFMWRHPSLFVSSISSLLLLLPKSRGEIRAFFSSEVPRGSRSGCNTFLSGISFLSFSSASWTGYIFLLGESDMFQPRYVIIGILLVPFLLASLGSQILAKHPPLQVNNWIPRLIYVTGISCILLANKTFANFNPVLPNGFAHGSIRKHAVPAKLMKEEKAKVIFSSFWDVEIGIYLENGTIILPVGKDGLPDLWAHGKSLFQKAILKLEATDDPIYFYVSNNSRPLNLIKIWGTPDKVDISTAGDLGLVRSEFLILKYAEPLKRQKIIRHISQKLDTYSQNCNRGSALFAER